MALWDHLTKFFVIKWTENQTWTFGDFLGRSPNWAKFRFWDLKGKKVSQSKSVIFNFFPRTETSCRQKVWLFSSRPKKMMH
jgi:hypothetical protein